MKNINWKQILKWVAAILVLYLVYKVLSNRLSSPSGATHTLPDGSGGSVKIPALFVYRPDLVDRKKQFGSGSKNSQEVGYLQAWLNAWYHENLTVDGDFGAKTAAALLRAKPTANQLSTTLDALGI